ncbi:MAG TPA: RecX family transcriptional regulator [Actinomycetota bacterium]|nr:RecX family transcriptional regulator [Actinomycetota bacterium]
MPKSRAKNPLDVHDRALGLLAVRPRSRRELAGRLRQAGFEEAEVSDELARLEAVGLVDDEDFARQVAEHELRNRRSGDRVVVSRLLAKGVDRATIERVVADAGAEPETERALAVAVDRARRLGGLPPETAFARLVPFLQRRGFAPGTSRRAAGVALGLEADDD